MDIIQVKSLIFILEDGLRIYNVFVQELAEFQPEISGEYFK